MKKKIPTRPKSRVGTRIITGLKEAVAWTKGENVPAHVTNVEVPMVDVRAEQDSKDR